MAWVEHVQVLADRDLGAHLVEDRPGPGQRSAGRARRRAAARRTRPGTGRRAGSPRASPNAPASPRQPARRVQGGEPAVHRRLAAPGVGAVHQVVVDQRAGLHQLQRADGGDDAVVVGAAGAPVAPVRERRPQPLAAASTNSPAASHQREQVAGSDRPVAALAVQHRVQRGLIRGAAPCRPGRARPACMWRDGRGRCCTPDASREPRSRRSLDGGR